MILYQKKDMKAIERVGGKCLGLVKLLGHGLHVPDFFVIPSNVNLTDEKFKIELATIAEKLDTHFFAVRSSGTQEDGDKKSFAGQYKTELNVSKSELYQAVLRVAASSYSDTVKGYMGQQMTEQINNIAIVVQKQIQPKKAGVLFTSSPFSKDEVIIEEVEGMGDSLVSGEVTPVRKIYYKNRDNDVSGYEKELLETAILLEKKEGKPVDIEWAYDGELYFLQMRPITTVGDSLPDIGDKKWNLYVYRDFCRLCHSVQIEATKKNVQEKQFGIHMPVFEGILLNGREFYTDDNDRLSNKLWGKYDKGDFFDKFADRIEKSVKKTRQRANALKNNNDISSFNDSDLFSAYDREIERYVESYLPLMMRPDEYLFEKLCKQIGKDQAETLQKVLPALAKKTMYSQEKNCFLQAVFQKRPEKYLNAFEWSNNPLSVSSYRKGADEFEERAKTISIEQAQKELKSIIKREKHSKIIAEEAVATIKDESAKKTIEIIIRFIYLRTYTTENSDRYFFYIKEKILREIARRKDISLKTLLGMNYREVSRLRTGEPVDFDEQQKRNRGELIFFSEKGVRVYYGANTYMLLQKIIPTELPDTGSIFCGQVACSGEAEGRVRIIRSFSDVKKMNEGDILVTSMTTPEISLAVDKASGIITDEGGITCHAAIVAREWGIPCLIGTGKATSVLRDGMTIKLDCITGFFEIK